MGSDCLLSDLPGRPVLAVFWDGFPGNRYKGPDRLAAGFTLRITGLYSAVPAEVRERGLVSGSGGRGPGNGDRRVMEIYGDTGFSRGLPCNPSHRYLTRISYTACHCAGEYDRTTRSAAMAPPSSRIRSACSPSAETSE